MTLFLKVKTKIDDLEIKAIEAVTAGGMPLLLGWKSQSIARNQEGFNAELKDISFNGKDASENMGL